MGSQSTFMLLFRDATPEVYETMTREQRAEALDNWNNWAERLASQKRFLSGHPLEPLGKVVSGSRGERILDGPFSEAKEILGGYFLIAAADLEEATAIARECPNLQNGMIVEVRPVAGACPLALSLGETTMRSHAG